MRDNDIMLKEFKTAQEAVEAIKKHREEDNLKSEGFLLENAYIKDIDFSRLNALNLVCARCIFEDCNFQLSGFSNRLSIDRCCFTRCNFNDADMSYGYLKNSLFDECSFDDTCMMNIHLKNTHFHHCCIDEAYALDGETEQMLYNLEKNETEHRLIEQSISKQPLWKDWRKNDKRSQK